MYVALDGVTPTTDRCTVPTLRYPAVLCNLGESEFCIRIIKIFEMTPGSSSIGPKVSGSVEWELPLVLRRLCQCSIPIERCFCRCYEIEVRTSSYKFQPLRHTFVSIGHALHDAFVSLQFPPSESCNADPTIPQKHPTQDPCILNTVFGNRFFTNQAGIAKFA